MLRDFGIHRGVNLGGWLSQCDYRQERLDGFIREEDFKQIAAWQMDHVRIPVDYNVLEDNQGSYDAPGWERLDFAVAMCEKYDLKMIIDLHKAAGFCFDYQQKEEGFFEGDYYPERFCRLWEEIARRYGHMPDRVLFELLNELTDSSYIDGWNRVSGEAIRRIRVYAPDTWIIVGSYNFNSAAAVPELAPPADGKVVYNFHCYAPFHYTHQGAGWVRDMDKSLRYAFEESGTTEELFEEIFAPAIAAAEKRGAPLYCGEYGVIDVVPPEDAIKWFRVIHAVLEKHGIPRAVWSYKQMDFGISDSRWDAGREELLKLL